jgi:PAT family beta-lactamase induction signal transducer AmpG
VIGWSATYLLCGLLFLLLALTMLLAPVEPPRQVPHGGNLLKQEMAALRQQPWLLTGLLCFLLALLWPVIPALNLAWAVPFKSAWWYKGGVAVFLLLLAALLFHRGLQQQTGKQAQAASSGPVFGAIIALLNKPHAALLIVFILIFKLADSSIGFMIKPFWVDSGFSNTQIGLVSVNIGLALSIAGGILGGWYTDRVGIFKGLWVLGLTQAVSNLGYVLAAMFVPQVAQGSPIEFNHQLLMYTASAIESFTGGLGTAAFLAFLMVIVDKNRATTEYAILSSIFAFSRSIAGWAGGIGAQEMGYAMYFMLTFVLAFPAYILLPWIKQILIRSEEKS